MAASPEAIASAGPPRISRLLRELADIPGSMVAPLLPAASPPKVGKGEAVFVIPGFLTRDSTTSVLRRSLDAAGFRTFGWRQGPNLGISDKVLQGLISRLDEVAEAGGGKAVLVGWSLGGIYARALANHFPDKVRLVVTLASPFAGSLRANHAWRIYERINGHAIEDLPVPMDYANKPPVPTVAVWSPLDGIVAPLTSQGDASQSDEQIELPVTHMGFVTSRRAADEVARLLGERLSATRP